MLLLARELLNSGVSPDLVNEDGLTALHQVHTQNNSETPTSGDKIPIQEQILNYQLPTWRPFKWLPVKHTHVQQCAHKHSHAIDGMKLPTQFTLTLPLMRQVTFCGVCAFMSVTALGSPSAVCLYFVWTVTYLKSVYRNTLILLVWGPVFGGVRATWFCLHSFPEQF